MPYARQKPGKRRCAGLSTIRITLECLPKIEGVKQHSKSFRFAYGGKPSQQPQISEASDPACIAPHSISNRSRIKTAFRCSGLCQTLQT